jgi:hypothetical protein
MMEDSGANLSNKLSWWRRRNWWKIGFFLMCVIFEFTREIAVMTVNSEPKIAISAYVESNGTHVNATGRWMRIDGGGRMVPGATSIICDQSEGQCIEVAASIFNGYLNEPNVDIFDATFGQNAVTYENNDPRCVRYNVRIDLKLKKVFAVRERKPNVDNEICKNSESRIEMTLGDGYQREENQLNDHFVPLLRLIAWVF